MSGCSHTKDACECKKYIQNSIIQQWKQNQSEHFVKATTEIARHHGERQLIAAVLQGLCLQSLQNELQDSGELREHRISFKPAQLDLPARTL